MGRIGTLPSPSAYLDPLTGLTTCHYYTVPKYFYVDHPNTRWLLSMIRSQDTDRIHRKMELQPNAFRVAYFQLLDCPQLYSGDDPMAQPMFHRLAVLYVSLLGMAMYLKRTEVVKMILNYRDMNDEPLYTIQDPQYATHVQDASNGDFHAFPLAIMMLRSGCFDYTEDMLTAAEWNPQAPICMPLRRRYQRKALYFLDWLDYTLWLLHERPMLKLAQLVHSITASDRYQYRRLPMEIFKPESEAKRVPTGLIDVEVLPEEARMIGTKSLLEITEDYSIYLQCKERYEEIRATIKEIVSDGFNPEVMMARAQDYDGYQENDGEEGDTANNANNNAASMPTMSSMNNSPALVNNSGKKRRGPPQQGPFASEPTRVLWHALQTDAKPCNKTPLNPLLDAVAVYIKRNVYLIAPLPPKKRGKGDKGSAEDQKSNAQLILMRKRDARNTIVLLLNLMQQQFDKINKLNTVQRSKDTPRHKHVDPAKKAANKRVTLTDNVKRISKLLFMVLLHSREILHFVEADYPTYKTGEDGSVNFQMNPGLEHTLRGIKLDVMAQFSLLKAPGTYLTLSELERAAEVKEMYVNLRVGKPPPMDPNAVEKLNDNKDARGRRGPKNASNVNASSNATEPHELSEGDLLMQRLLRGEDITDDGDEEQPVVKKLGGRVSFKRVMPRMPRASILKSSGSGRQIKPNEGAEETPEPEAVDEAGEESKQQEREEEEEEPLERLLEKQPNNEAAAKLAEQISQLRQSAREGNAADGVLADVYARIVRELLLKGESLLGGTAAAAVAGASDGKNGEGRLALAAARSKVKVGGGEQDYHDNEDYDDPTETKDDKREETIDDSEDQAYMEGPIVTRDDRTAQLSLRARLMGLERRVVPVTVVRRRRLRTVVGAGSGGVVVGRRFRQRPCQYQKARVRETRPEGTEFDLNSN